MTTISAEVVLASLNKSTGDVLTTYLLRYPRFIHSELMTHRVFSRNAASSRAIPVHKLIDQAVHDPATPLYWYKNQPGMQGRVFMEQGDRAEALLDWDMARLDAIRHASKMAQTGAHKQIVNRILEPFTHITTVVSGTEWSNFFELRLHEDAEPHFRVLAEAMKEASAAASVQILRSGDWHLPFAKGPYVLDSPTRDEVKYSVACCASTSYKTVEGFDMTQEVANKICKKLMSVPLHASPLEHVAVADSLWGGEYLKVTSNRNYKGFIQLRAMVELDEYALMDTDAGNDTDGQS